MTDNVRTVLALSRLPGVGGVRLRRLLSKLKAEAKEELSFLDIVERFNEYLPRFSRDELDQALTRADELADRAESLGISVRPYAWPSYPPQLERLEDPPALLFSIGDFRFERRPRIAVIGTRKPTKWGLKTARDCAAKIADSRGVTVSGLALGIDAEAHSASIKHGGPTWAVLAHGLHTVSPSSNREIAKLIVEKGGALVSEYAPGEPAQRHYFVERDRIQAGLSDAVLVIESGMDGGSMHTVKFARDARVPVWVTFPQTKIREAEANSRDLPEAQQGTWHLLCTKRASRVPTVKALDRMLTSFTFAPDVPPKHDTLFSTQ
jgi:DNA protecting protein DprA